MKLMIDGDACPVIKECEFLASKYQIPMIVFCDVNHDIQLEYGNLLQVDQGRDHTDLVLVNKIEKGDIVITQDYALASLALTKQAHVLSFFGKAYTLDNIDELLFSRYVGQKIRRSSKKVRIKGPKKRTPQDDENFVRVLEILLIRVML